MGVRSTYFGLLAEFDAAEVRLEECCEKYFGLSPAQAKRKASEYKLPVKAYRSGASQKAGWLISITDLAQHIDAQKKEADRIFKAMSSDSQDEGACNDAEHSTTRVA